MLAMVLYPDVQKKAQVEIDLHCPHRLPTFADFNSLPYCHAIVKEILRWNPVVPLGTFTDLAILPGEYLNLCLAVPHRCSSDDFYKGYYIPKDSLLVGNTWYGYSRDSIFAIRLMLRLLT